MRPSYSPVYPGGKETAPDPPWADQHDDDDAFSQLLPVGGLEGQHLAKRTNADFDTEWVASDATEYAVHSEYTAAELNAAIAAASMDGSELFWFPGTYTPTAKLALGSGNHRWRGILGKTIISAVNIPAGSNLLATTILSGVLGAYENGTIDIEGIVFDGNNNILSPVNTALVRLYKCTPHIRRCTFKRHRYIQLALGGVSNAVIQDNEFTDWGSASVLAEGGAALWHAANPADQTFSINGRISGNKFHDGEWTPCYDFGDSTVYANNQHWNFKEAGYFSGAAATSGTGNTATSSVIVGNSFKNCTLKSIDSSIIVLNGHGQVAVGNTIHTSDGPGFSIGVDAHNNIAMGNTIVNCCRDTVTFANFGQITIRVSHASYAPSGISILYNTIRDLAGTPVAPYGIRFFRAAGALSIDKLRVIGNDLNGAAASPANNLVLTPAGLGSDYLAFDNYGATDLKRVLQQVNVAGIPTSAAGLVAGDVWSNAGVLTVVP